MLFWNTAYRTLDSPSLSTYRQYKIKLCMIEREKNDLSHHYYGYVFLNKKIDVLCRGCHDIALACSGECALSTYSDEHIYF